MDMKRFTWHCFTLKHFCVTKKKKKKQKHSKSMQEQTSCLVVKTVTLMDQLHFKVSFCFSFIVAHFAPGFSPCFSKIKGFAQTVIKAILGRT